MERKKIAKNLLKNLGLSNIKVKYGNDYSICTTTKKPFITIPKNIVVPCAETQVWYNDFCKANGIEIDFDWFGLFHEIGHIITFDDIENYHNSKDEITIMLALEIIDLSQAVNRYYEIEQEKNANSWALNFIKENYEVVKDFEKYWLGV